MIFRNRLSTATPKKPYIYLAMHAQDHEAWLEVMIRDVLEQVDATVFYSPSDGLSNDAEERADDVAEMNAVVVAVTRCLLEDEDCNALADVRLAQQLGVPLIPVVLQRGLDSLFGVRFGDIEYLDRASNDITRIPYAKKLGSRLASLFSTSEERDSISEAFSHHAFLSYRKKNRAQSKEAMRVIRQDRRLVDTAIWYDEFLTPGESFNEDIDNKLNRSDVMLLLVTPDLLERGNYVMSTEYPHAQEIGVPVLPIEAERTDIQQLKAMYDCIAAPLPLDEPTAIHEALVMALGDDEGARDASGAQPTLDAKRAYLLGLAYLEGVEVETDRELGFRLVKEAAEGGYRDAMKKLSALYRTGAGTPRDIGAALCWEKRYVEAVRLLCSDEGPIDNDAWRAYFFALWDWREDTIELGDKTYAQEALAGAREMLWIAEGCLQECRDRGAEAWLDGSASFWLHMRVTCIDFVGDAYLNAGDMASAVEIHEQALVAADEALRRIDAWLGRAQDESDELLWAMRQLSLPLHARMRDNIIRDAAISHKRLEDIALISRDADALRVHREMSLRLWEALNPGIRSGGDEAPSHDHVVYLRRRALQAMFNGRWDDASQCLKQAHEMALRLSQYSHDAEAHYDLAVIEGDFGWLSLMQKDYEEGLRFSLSAIQRMQKLDADACTLDIHGVLYAFYEHAGDCWCGLSDYQMGANCYVRAWQEMLSRGSEAKEDARACSDEAQRIAVKLVRTPHWWESCSPEVTSLVLEYLAAGGRAS